MIRLSSHSRVPLPPVSTNFFVPSVLILDQWILLNYWIAAQERMRPRGWRWQRAISILTFLQPLQAFFSPLHLTVPAQLEFSLCTLYCEHACMPSPRCQPPVASISSPSLAINNTAAANTFDQLESAFHSGLPISTQPLPG